MGNITASEAISVITHYVQVCRSEGETDLRSILSICSQVTNMINEGKTYDEIFNEVNGDE